MKALIFTLLTSLTLVGCSELPANDPDIEFKTVPALTITDDEEGRWFNQDGEQISSPKFPNGGDNEVTINESVDRELAPNGPLTPSFEIERQIIDEVK